MENISTTDHISREAAIELLSQPITMSMCLSTDECHHKIAQQRIDRYLIENIPAADVRPAEDYNKLLKAAKAMHTWIFLNTGDEQEVYDECHLDDEMNALLGYGGSFEIHMRKEQT